MYTLDDLREDLDALITYVGPDEEEDFEQQDEDGQENHIVHVIRRLGEWIG